MIPKALEKIRKKSARRRGALIRAYVDSDARPSRPAYLDEPDIIRSHAERSRMEISLGGMPIPDAPAHHACTRDFILGCNLDGEPGSLAELTIGAVADSLGSRGDLQVPAGFFSTMVAAADDYIDREGLYPALGERLFYLSHSYRDLVDIALTEKLEAGEITRSELHAIRLRLFEVVRTLAGSEGTVDADAYLYEKSCGDRVVDILLPTSKADKPEAEGLRRAARLIGEAGQLIDDVIDYESDIASGRKNHIVMKGIERTSALDLAEARVDEAGGWLSRPSESLLWIMESIKGVAGTLRESIGTGKTGAAGLLKHLGPILPEGSTTLMFWF